MFINLEKKDLTNTQQMEIPVNGPDGATHLILCTGIVNLGSIHHATYTFFVGPKISHRQFVGAIASGAISTIHAHNQIPLSNIAEFDLEANILCMTAQFDHNSGQVKVIAEVSSPIPMTKLSISYNVNILAELTTQ